MPVCYSFESKQYYKTDGMKAKTLKEAKGLLKKMICESCSIMDELKAISKKSLPSPKYRASVCKYLEKLFSLSDEFPSSDIIDYSDYYGEILELYLEDFESISDLELFDYANENDVKVGFVFYAGADGMALEFLNSVNNLMTKCFVKFSDDKIIFSYEPFKSNRPSLDVRINKVEGTFPKMLTGSFYLVLLLDELLHQNKKCQIEPKILIDYSMEKAREIKEVNEEDGYLSFLLSERILDKMQKVFVLPSEVRRSPITIERDIDKLIKFGFDVKDDKREFSLCDYKGDSISSVINRYYVPPLICKNDADDIITAINNSCVDEEKKVNLINKFKVEVGYNRVCENDCQEIDYPLPQIKEWDKGMSSLIMFYMLRLCARLLPVTSDRGESLQSLIKEHFGVELKKNAMISNLNSMQKIGLPIIDVGKNEYCFDTSELLSKNDLDEIVNYIANDNSIYQNRREQLIRKINNKFIIEKY